MIHKGWMKNFKNKISLCVANAPLIDRAAELTNGLGRGAVVEASPEQATGANAQVM